MKTCPAIDTHAHTHAHTECNDVRGVRDGEGRGRVSVYKCTWGERGGGGGGVGERGACPQCSQRVWENRVWWWEGVSTAACVESLSERVEINVTMSDIGELIHVRCIECVGVNYSEGICWGEVWGSGREWGEMSPGRGGKPSGYFPLWRSLLFLERPNCYTHSYDPFFSFLVTKP